MPNIISWNTQKPMKTQKMNPNRQKIALLVNKKCERKWKEKEKKERNSQQQKIQKSGELIKFQNTNDIKMCQANDEVYMENLKLP